MDRMFKIFFLVCIIAVLFHEITWILNCNAIHKRIKGSNTQHEVLQRNMVTQPVSLRRCTPRKNIVFVKTHKTGGTTLARIIEQYAFDNKLNVVIKKGEYKNFHFANVNFDFNSKKYFVPPMGVKQGDYKNYKYNVFALHALYNRPVYDSFMENGSIYVTLLRDPVSQFESAFDFFNVGAAAIRDSSLNKTQRLQVFFKDPLKYWTPLKRSQRLISRNSQIWDLGVDPAKCPNSFVVDYTIKRLDNELDLVMITEYFDESLLLLKKKLCWEFKDILYLPRNVRSSRATLNVNIRKNISKWNWIDTKIYSHFLGRLHKLIKDYGPRFEDDLSAFRNMTSFVYKTCVANEKVQTFRKRKKIAFDMVRGNVTGHGGICRRVGKLDECNFGNGYILLLDLSYICESVTSSITDLNPHLKNMMKRNTNRTVRGGGSGGGDDEELGE
ncbi:galactosylceramide sulfotransferase-like [Anneissia japonica]|uniref:galactosylceramide sulfotransferase-like n=1 Tax=Anneissia japonica TaxID=1529436 RepID=UPI0014259BEF|nr:galactosylceramide sulfotransferase-like [Anneissia japonica]